MAMELPLFLNINMIIKQKYICVYSTSENKPISTTDAKAVALVVLITFINNYFTLINTTIYEYIILCLHREIFMGKIRWIYLVSQTLTTQNMQSQPKYKQESIYCNKYILLNLWIILVWQYNKGGKLNIQICRKICPWPYLLIINSSTLNWICIIL